MPLCRIYIKIKPQIGKQSRNRRPLTASRGNQREKAEGANGPCILTRQNALDQVFKEWEDLLQKHQERVKCRWTIWQICNCCDFMIFVLPKETIGWTRSRSHSSSFKRWWRIPWSRKKPFGIFWTFFKLFFSKLRRLRQIKVLWRISRYSFAVTELTSKARAIADWLFIFPEWYERLWMKSRKLWVLIRGKRRWISLLI